MEYNHVPVLMDEVLELLDVKAEGVYIDGTLGGGGHTRGIARKLGQSGRLICIDRDEDAIRNAAGLPDEFGGRVIVARENFVNAKALAAEFGYNYIDGALIDLGVSSHQIDTAERGFSYMREGPLDMRMSADSPLTAENIVNTYSRDRLERLFYTYGEERYASIIARAIIKEREEREIHTTTQLNEIIEKAVAHVRTDGGHKAKRVYQALRIEVNDELGIIRPAIESIVSILKPGGRLALITFHSLEDRIVKETFAQLERDCICPPRFPVCVCDKRAEVKILTKKPIIAGDDEIKVNSRSKSAKLRVCEKQ